MLWTLWVWPEIRRYLRKYPSAVLTGLDSAGYPLSVRCKPEINERMESLRIELPAGIDLKSGPAGILCHSHNLFLWKLRSFLVRGSLEMVDGSLLFRPSRFVPGIGVGGLPGMVRFATSKREVAKRYLKQRSLARPTIPWDDLRRLQREVRQS